MPAPAEHTDVFVLQLYPYASVYLGAEGMLGGEARDRVAGFWRALELEPPAEPDHLAALLALYATLLEAGTAEAALLWEHLLTWLPAYLHRLGGLAGGAYRAWGDLLLKALLEEAAARRAPPATPLQLRDVPALPDPREQGGQAFLQGLLAPVRTGFILVREDLAQAAGELGLGLRQGERRYVLEALLGQDGQATLGWLASLAERWAAAHRALPPVLSPVSRFWAARAEAAGALLRKLSAEGA